MCDPPPFTDSADARDIGLNDIDGPAFQKRLDLSITKVTRLNERWVARLGVDAFNLTNTPSFDVPTNSASQYSVNSTTGAITNFGLSSSFGVVQHTIGSPRFMQISLTLAF